MNCKNTCDILKEVKKDELAVIKNQLKNYFPQSIRTYGTLCMALNGLHLPTSQIFVRDGDGSQMTVIVKDFYTAGSDPLATTVVLFSSNPDTFLETLKTTTVFDWSKRYFFSGIPFPLSEILKDFLSSKDATIESYFVDVHQLLDTKNLIPENQIPDNIYVAPLREEHAEDVNRTWKFGHPSLTKELKARIEKYITAGVYLKHNNALISWIIQQPFGSIGSLYTLPEYRGKGYAKLAISHASKRLLENNLEVFCGVEDYNKSSKILMEKLGFIKQFQQCFLSYIPKIG